MPDFPITQADAATELGVTTQVVNTLVRGLKIPTVPIPHNGMGRAIRADDYPRLREAVENFKASRRGSAALVG